VEEFEEVSFNRPSKGTRRNGESEKRRGSNKTLHFRSLKATTLDDDSECCPPPKHFGTLTFDVRLGIKPRAMKLASEDNATATFLKRSSGNDGVGEKARDQTKEGGTSNTERLSRQGHDMSSHGTAY